MEIVARIESCQSQVAQVQWEYHGLKRGAGSFSHERNGGVAAQALAGNSI